MPVGLWLCLNGKKTYPSQPVHHCKLYTSACVRVHILMHTFRPICYSFVLFCKAMRDNVKDFHWKYFQFAYKADPSRSKHPNNPILKQTNWKRWARNVEQNIFVFNTFHIPTPCPNPPYPHTYSLVQFNLHALYFGMWKRFGTFHQKELEKIDTLFVFVNFKVIPFWCRCTNGRFKQDNSIVIINSININISSIYHHMKIRI